MQPDRLAEIDAVLEQALDLEPTPRGLFLDARCAADGELRVAVERLLALAEGGDGAVDELLRPVRQLVGAIEHAAPRADALPPGSILGAYRVVRPLGRGGMGEVVLAERSDGRFEHQVAIKVLSRAVDSPEAVRRFELERQILARLSHPHIAHLVDGGVDPRGLPYLVMEHVEGVPLDQHCDAERLDVDARLRLVIAVARAVHAAHRSLVIHRDIKPSNLIVGRGGVVKLLDFGIAKLVDPAAADLGLTVAAGHPLTPTYASPEQVRGAPITTSSDVYQLGLLLYELLTGRRPQAATTGSLAELVRLVCEKEPAAPSRAVLETAADEPSAEERARLRRSTPARLVRRYRDDLDAIVARALDKDPERRYASAEELAADLERHLDGRPVRARRGTLAYRARKFVRRNAAATLVGGMAIVLTLGYAVAVTFQTRTIARERNRAQLEAEKAREVERFVLGLFDAADPNESGGGTVTARDLLASGVDRVDRELAGQPEVQARMLSTLGLVQARLGLLDEAIALHRRSLAMRRELFGREHPDTAESALRLGAALRRKGDPVAAAPLLEEALASMRLLRPGTAELTSALSELGSLRLTAGEDEAALPLFEESLALRRTLGKPQLIATGLNEMGLVHFARRDLDAATHCHREALAINRRLYGDHHVKVAVPLFNLGRTLQERNDYAAALPLFEEALAIERAAYGPDHPEVGTDLVLVASTLRRLGELDRAEPLLAEALRIYRAKLDPGHTRMATLLAAIGWQRLAQGRLDEAEQHLRAALAIRRQRLGSSHEAVGETLASLGNCLAAQGRRIEAVAAWNQALPMVAGKRPNIEQMLRQNLTTIDPPAVE